MAEPFQRAKVLRVMLGDALVGAVTIDERSRLPVFEYAQSWIEGGTVDLAPLQLPAVHGPRTFPQLQGTAFRGLPGLLADSLPGMFADDLTHSWLARHGIQPGQITAVDRLAYLGDRAMGRCASSLPQDRPTATTQPRSNSPGSPQLHARRSKVRSTTRTCCATFSTSPGLPAGSDRRCCSHGTAATATGPDR